jgi:hypothetical protein
MGHPAIVISAVKSSEDCSFVEFTGEKACSGYCVGNPDCRVVGTVWCADESVWNAEPCFPEGGEEAAEGAEKIR